MNDRINLLLFIYKIQGYFYFHNVSSASDYPQKILYMESLVVLVYLL